MTVALWAVVEAGLELLEKLLGDRSPPALDAADDAVRALREGMAGRVTPEGVAAELEVFARALARNDAAADTALDKKFGGEG